MKKLNFTKQFATVNPRYISYSYFGVSVVVCSIFLFFFIRPTLIEAGRLVKTIEKGEIVDKQLTTKLENLAKAEATINEHKELIPLIDLALPDIVDSPNFVDYITDIALKQNINVNTINSTNIESSTTGTSQTINFTINFSGDYLAISKFLSNIENNIQMLTIENVSISKSSDQFNGSLSISTYGYKFNPDSIQTEIVPLIGEQK
ncbi:MAG: type 4a pilus biogenesis protein PilO [bacterium]|nr:type 4a pilus biogenesis protein PilO [bacterium]